jgi:Lar family restriction alleviation protein
MSGNLLPCPFCGAKAKILNYSGAFRVVDTNYKCSVTFSERWYKTEQEAIDAWNRRAPDIVYCRECKYGVPNAFQCGLVLCQNEFFRRYRLFNFDDYCSFGERRGQDNKE